MPGLDPDGDVAPSGDAGCHSDEVRAALEPFLSATAGRGARILASELLARLERGDSGLPPMPQAVLRARDLIDRPDCGVPELAREIECDPALAARLVSVANSPYYAGMEPVQSIADAVVRVGLRETRHILVAVAMRSKVFKVPGFEERIEGLWRHAVAASLCTQTLAAEAGRDPDPAFLAGLVHDVGRVSVLAALADLRRAHRGELEIEPESVDAVASAVHPALGAVIAASWSFTDDVVDAVARHHAARAGEGVPDLAAVLCAADLLARVVSGEVEADVLESTPWPLVSPSAATAAELVEELRESFEGTSKSLT